MNSRIVSIALVALFISRSLTADDVLVLFEKARENFQRGRYEEAIECLDEFKGDAAKDLDPVKVALLHLEAQLAQGDVVAAEETLAASMQDRESAALLAQRARLRFGQGRYDEANQDVGAALAIDGDQLLARLVQAQLFTEKGELKKADEAYRWFVRFYNQKQPADAESLVLVAQGASQYALWHSSAQILDFCVNTVSVDALKVDKTYWQAHLVSGRLLLEKYNKSQGRPELKAALAINPNAADVHVELAKSAVGDYDWDEVEEEAKRALQINPRSTGAFQALATAKLYFRDSDAAEKLLADALQINPVETETLALLAALRMLQDGWPDPTRWKELVGHLDHIADLKLADPTRCEQILIDVATRNPKPGIFLASLAEVVDMFRQHSVAEPLLKQAILLMPQLSQPKNALGQLYMQTGQIDAAKRTLDEAFKADPYHVRVSNMRKVIKVLDDYESIETAHFVIRADGKLDKLLARYMGEYLEEVYPELTSLFGYEPEARTQIEIYNTAKGLSGHQWFSARMVGLPWVQTIGASTGVIIAMQSPGSMEKPLNWARVLKHEFVHVLTLQQTQFNIPHWYTEALAVRSEGYPRPVEWNALLLDRVPKGELKNLDNLSMGFIRAGNIANWNFAYCQSVLYAEYIVKRFGEKSLAGLLDAYRRNLSTDKAIPEVFGVSKEDFEQGYRQYLDAIVASLHRTEADSELNPSRVERAYEKNKGDPDAAANYARLMLLIRKRNEAKSIAQQVLKTNPKHPVAAAVLATLYYREEKFDDAISVLEPAFDKEHPNKRILEILMKTRLQQKRAAEAIELCELGKQHFPDESEWWKGIANAAKMTGEHDRRRAALETLVQIESDDPAPRKALAEMSLADKQYDQAYRFAKLAIHIDVLDADIHRMLAEAFRGLEDYKRSIEEYEIALELKPKAVEFQLGLVETYIAAGRTDEAKKLVDEIFKSNPNNERVHELKEAIK
ncbi:tetratricopeptide repeat protein [Schlesneria paludicola]|uniref:tetratricopeptide repeat protein n=1 Tax=Schlesneria paludicola TaxID=360056 RepID=UPI00138AB510|nr:tetratricopeptide repeat protein [Schlesneria paludicola]